MFSDFETFFDGYVMVGIGLLLILIFFILGAIGLYKLLKNRGIKYGWLSFIPVLSAFVIGNIADLNPANLQSNESGSNDLVLRCSRRIYEIQMG